MVQEAPIQGKPGSGSGGSMWPVLVLGLLTAIFAWIWYRGHGDTREQEEVVDPTVTRQDSAPAAHLPAREIQLSAPHPDPSKQDSSAVHPAAEEPQPTAPHSESSNNQQKLSRLGAQEKKALNSYTTVSTGETAIKEQKIDLLEVKGHPTHLLTEEHPTDILKEEQIQADTYVHHTAVLREDNLQADTQEHPTEALREEELKTEIQEHPTEILREEELQADTQEHPTEVLREEELQADTQEHPTEVLREEELQADTQEHPTYVLRNEELQAESQEHPSCVLRDEELQAHSQEHPTEALREEELKTEIQEHPTEILREEEPQADTQEHPTEVLREGELQADTREYHTDVLREGELQANTQGHRTEVLREEETNVEIQKPLPDVPRREELHGNVEEDPTNIKKEEPQAGIQELPTHSLKIEGWQAVKHVNNLLKNNLEEIHKDISFNNDEGHSYEVDMSESRRILINGDQGLKKEVEQGIGESCFQNEVAVKANGEVVCSTKIAKKLEAPKIPGDSCDATLSAQENGSPQEAKTSPDFALENSLKGNENARNVLETQEKLTKDAYLEMGSTSTDKRNLIFGDQFIKQESLEKCDIEGMHLCSDSVKPTEGNNEFFASSLNESTQKGLSNVETSGAVPDLSMTNMHEIEHQKTRKVATIQPMPQNVNVAFKVHYITHSDSQVIAITGDHKALGKWEEYIPLTSGNGGFWSHSISLPADTNIAWKFVMVENGKIERWEECNNRFLKVAHEDIDAELWWGYPE